MGWGDDFLFLLFLSFSFISFYLQFLPGSFVFRMQVTGLPVTLPDVLLYLVFGLFFF